MRVYVYNEITKEYERTQEAQRNPKRPTEYLKPANSTTEQLPAYDKETQTVVFNEHWEVKADHRGEKVLNLATLGFETVDYIGDIKEGYQLLNEEIAEDFAAHPEAYKVVDNELVSIRGTAEWVEYLENEFAKEFIQTAQGNVRVNTSWGNFLAIKPNYDFQVQNLGMLPANVMVLYKTPNFAGFANIEDMHNWLITEGQFKNDVMTLEQYMAFSNEIQAYFLREVQ